MKSQLIVLWLVVVSLPCLADTTPTVDTAPATLSNKTISGASNTLSSIAPGSLSSQALGTVIGNSTNGSATPLAINFDAVQSATEFGFVAGVDNTAAWATLNTYIAGTCTRVIVNFPPGTYYANTISIQGQTNGTCYGQSVTIQGAGPGRTIFKANVTSSPIFFHAVAGAPSNYLTLRDFSLDCSLNADQHCFTSIGHTILPGTTGGNWYNLAYNIQVSNCLGICWLEKGGFNGGLVPQQFESRINVFAQRTGTDYSWPSLMLWGQVGQGNWINTDFSNGGGSPYIIGPNVWLGNDPRLAQNPSTATVANPGVITTQNDPGWYANGQSVQVVGTALPPNTAINTRYWICNEVTSGGNQTVDLCSSAANANAGTAINFTGCTTACSAPGWYIVAWDMQPASCNTSTNVCTTNWAHLLTDGDTVQVYGSNLPSGLSTGTVYYITSVSDNQIAFSSSLVNQQAGTYVALSTTGTIGDWGIGVVSTGREPYSQYFSNLNSQNGETSVLVDEAYDIHLGVHDEVSKYGIKVRNSAQVNVDGGLFSLAGENSGIVFSAWGSRSNLNISAAPSIGSTFNQIAGTGAGGAITGMPANLPAFPSGTNTTGNGVTAPWASGTFTAQVSVSSNAINMGQNTTALLNSNASSINYITSILIPGSIIQLRCWPNSGTVCVFGNGGNIDLNGLSTLTVPTGINLSFMLADGLGITWTLLGPEPGVGTATNNNASAGLVGEYWDTNCPVVTSGASIAFTNASPTVGTYSSPPWANSQGAPFGSYACPFYISATAPTGLSTNTTYWAVPQSATTFKVATTAANAMAGTFANTTGSTTTSTLVSSTYQTATTTVIAVGAMNLTAGDWDCQMSGIFLPQATTSVTNEQAGINSSSTAIGALGSYVDFETAANVMTAANNPILVSPMFRESLSATTAEYAVAEATFTLSTMNEAGDFRCRRVR